jgi:hypothetical protein
MLQEWPSVEAGGLLHAPFIQVTEQQRSVTRNGGGDDSWSKDESPLNVLLEALERSGEAVAGVVDIAEEQLGQRAAGGRAFKCEVRQEEKRLGTTKGRALERQIAKGA